jgi:thioredoxin reductase (NADPH)
MPNVEVVRNTLVHAMAGDSHLRAVELQDRKTGQKRRIETSMLFSFIGASPKTEWLPPEIARDAHGFVRTGTELMDAGLWTTKRPPFLLETSRPGVLAAGDVRSNSVKRVASAVGEGAMAVQFVHEYLKTI